MKMQRPAMAGVLWWPHSGGRWLCRNLIKPHPAVLGTVFTHPWIFVSTDMTLETDITAQVHKARSLPELKEHLAALITSTDKGREEGLRVYFDHIRTRYIQDNTHTHIVGEMCMGSPVPRSADLAALFRACPDFRIIHLVRHPVTSFPSFQVRHEFDADPVKAAGSWVTLNAGVRLFFEQHPDLAGQYKMVRYEDLLEDTEKELKEVCAFLQLNFTPEMTKDLKTRWGRNTRPEVPENIAAVIRDLAAGELARYGY